MFGSHFFVVRENLADHWLGNEIQACNLRGRHEIRGCAADPESKAQFGFGHLGAALGPKFRPNLGLGTSVSYIWILPN